MAPSDITNDVQIKETPPSAPKDGSVPSGFILKLFQMVNGAPDDVISWMPEGDAFKIGADLAKLESETLPKYFRHSRFQSLVRQLNFYNFRKVNRERTFWVYKHDLFHRDHPEDLHLLRRRTCPGVDGRKNRFSGSGGGLSRRISEENLTRLGNDSLERKDVSDDSSVENETVKSRPKKRSYDGKGKEGDVKRVGQGIAGYSFNQNVSVDLTVGGKKLHTVREVEDGSGSGDDVDDRLARREQAHIVSQVAMKLDAYARKAKRSIGRSRSGGGIVTPPVGGGHLPSGHYYRSVLTYDDEYEAIAKRSPLSVNVIADVESEDDRTPPGSPTSPAKPTVLVFDKPPVDDVHLVRTISDDILQRQMEGPRNSEASAALAGFCMSNAPDENNSELCAKILGLLSSCEKLAHDFTQYRYALHPYGLSNTSSIQPSCVADHYHQGDTAFFPIHQIWERAASRRDAVRDFKTFAINYITKDLERLDLCPNQFCALRQTAQAWSQSTCA